MFNFPNRYSFSLVLFIEMTFPSDLAPLLKKLKNIYVDVWILFCFMVHWCIPILVPQCVYVGVLDNMSEYLEYKFVE